MVVVSLELSMTADGSGVRIALPNLALYSPHKYYDLALCGRARSGLPPRKLGGSCRGNEWDSGGEPRRIW
jgi:hypothetical protein